jgi:hypothetical protein
MIGQMRAQQELTLYPSLVKRGTFTPSLLKSKIPPFDRLRVVSEVEPLKAGRRGQGMSSINVNILS